MKYGIHYAYWQHQWAADLASYITRAKKIGFDILEISGDGMLSCSDEELKSLRKLSEDNNISINPCQGMPKDASPDSDDPNEREQAVEFAKRMFDKMDILGCKQLGGILYSWWPTMTFSNKNIDIDKLWDNSLEGTSKIAKEAKDRGILLTLEVVNRYENYLFNNVKEALRFVNELGYDNVKLLLDIYHMNIEEDSIGDSIRMAGDKLGHFHIGECNRKVPGRGHMPWTEIGAALKDINYNAGITMEPFVQAGGEVADAVRVWRDLEEISDSSLDQDLVGALSFVKSVFD